MLLDTPSSQRLLTFSFTNKTNFKNVIINRMGHQNPALNFEDESLSRLGHLDIAPNLEMKMYLNWDT